LSRVQATILGTLLALALVRAAGVGSARADVVRLKIGRDLFGQGWMFLDTDGRCKVVTAAHVVRGADGTLRLPLVLDGRGREWPAGPALVVSTDPDIAVLAIPSANAPSACGDGRLSAIGAERRATEMEQAVIVTTGQSEVIEVPVARRASAMDAGRGELFTVRPSLASDRVMKGWSGSVVRDAAGPIGIVFEVDPDHNEAYAVRVDVIRRLMATAATPVPQAAAAEATRPAIGVLAGTTDDPASGPDLVLGTGWHVTPLKRTVVFVVAFRQPTTLRRVTLAAAGGAGNRIEGLGIATQAEGTDGWLDAGFCRTPEGSGAVACALLQRTVDRMRLVVKTASDAPIVLTGLTVE
jgi:hypothetical protein